MKRLFAAALVAGGMLAGSVSTTIAEDVATGGGAVALMGAEATNRMTRGKLDACELSYRVAFEDHIYRQGGITVIRGNLSLWGMINEPDKVPAVFLKVTAFDTNGQTLKLSPLDYAYLSVGGQSYAGKEIAKLPSDDGGLMMLYDMVTNPDLALGLDGQISISITRQGGRSDVSIPMYLQRDKPEAALQHTKCVGELLKAIQAKFKAQ